MKYKNTKIIEYDGIKVRFTVTFSLDDECRNGVCHFGITGDGVAIENSQYFRSGEFIFGGCCHDEIAKYFPELVQFFPLHGCNEFGQPMHSVVNFIYFIGQRKTDSELCEMFRCPVYQLYALRNAAHDKEYFTYMLFELGVVKKWREDAEKAIAWLEEQTGETFTHTENPRFTLEITEECTKHMTERIKNGEFTDEAVKAKKRAEHLAWQTKQIEEALKEFELDLKFIRRRKELQFWIITHCPTTNYSFFAYNDYGRKENPEYKLTINAHTWEPIITKDEFNKFVSMENIPKDLSIKLRGDNI